MAGFALLTRGSQTYTVEFSRDGQPEMAFIVGRVKDSGHRFVANHGDSATLQRLSSALEEHVSETGSVAIRRTARGEPEGNVFFLRPRAAL